MTLLWHDAAAGTWEACACRMAGGEAPPPTPPSALARQLLVVFLVLRKEGR